jgi:predicted HTH transcriptional regulator
MEKKFKLTESETVELKSSLSERHEILDTISAFSNTKGGVIYVGIDPQGRVIGINSPGNSKQQKELNPHRL